MENSVDSSVADLAASHHGLFGAHHLRDLRVADHERKYRLSIGRWIQVHERVYRIAGSPSTWPGTLLAACWAGGTRAVASHRSAAQLWELPGRTTQHVEITCPRWRRAQHEGLVVHESRTLDPIDVTIVDHIPVTSTARTIFDLTAVCGPTTVDLAIDNALRREITTLPDLHAVLDRLARRGRAGVVRFRELLADRDPADQLSESERERLLLRMLRRHGFPKATPQFEIRDDDGRLVARPDLAYPELKIAIEYESYEHHVGKAALVRDSARRNAVVALGWAPIAATAEDLRTGGHRLASDLQRARSRRSGVNAGE